MYNRQIYCKGWTPWFKTICLCKGINKLQEVRIILCFLQNQDHTSDRHFCSLIDEFPVWNSEPDQPTMMSWATSPEREEVPELHQGDLEHWWSLASLSRVADGLVAVWVVSGDFSMGWNNSSSNQWITQHQFICISISSLWLVYIVE